MNRSLAVLVLLTCTTFTSSILSIGQPPTTNAQATATNLNYAVTESGLNYRIWQATNYETTPSGQVIPHLHSFTELATGLNFSNSQTGQLTPSLEEIDILRDGTAAATNGQHQAYLPSDIYSGVIQVVTPDGQQLQSRPIGIAYFDGTNGVLLAAETNSIGQLIDDNQALYTNAFVNVAGNPITADVLCTYRKGGFECDLVLRSQLPAPEEFGLNSSNTRLELLTEFFSAPEPVQTPALGDPVNQIADTSLTFGTMTMGQGAAFAVNGSAQAEPSQITIPNQIPVCKTWTQISGRTILIEQVAYQSIAQALQTLPNPAAGTNAVSMNAPRYKVAGFPALPPSRIAQSPRTKTTRLAKAEFKRKPGLVVDYNIINTSQTNLTLQGDSTYFVTAPVTIQNLTIEGGAVVKYTNSSGPLLSITANSINCLTGPYKPAVFTTKDDNSIGQTVPGSTGSPGDQTGIAALTVNSTNNTLLHDLRILYTGTYGIQYTGSSATNIIRDVQIVHFDIGISGGTVSLENVLLSGGDIAIFTGGTAVNITVDSCSYLCDGLSSLLITNSVIANTPKFAFPGDSPGGFNNGFYNTSGDFGSSTYTNHAPPFQTAAGGDYYLTNGCNFLSGGTTNIDPVLLGTLGQRTVYPPMVFSNATISAATNLSPQASRDPTAAALGYHYDPLDFVFDNCTAQGNLTFNAGVALGWLHTSYLSSGLLLTNSTVNFDGTQAAPVYWVRLNTVQEQDLSGTPNAAGLCASNGTSVLNASFANFLVMADDFGQIGGIETNTYFTIDATDCEFLNGVAGGAYTAIALNLTNCLFESCYVEKVGPYWGDVTMRNCTMEGGNLLLLNTEDYPPVWTSSIRDCAFDGTTNTLGPLGSGPDYGYSCFDFGYNAFSGADNTYPYGYPPNPTNDVVVTNFNWQTSWLGKYYLPTNSPLTNAGDVAAGEVGLYYFTTHTNQIIQSNSIVDIGYHYVGTDTNGNAMDSSGDGIPDYWAAQYGFPVGVSDGLYGPDADPDGDGVNNLQEYQLGSSPVRPNSQNITINGYSYKQLTSALATTAKAYDVYYRSNSSAPWHRISSTVAGQTILTFVKPDAGEGDYIFLDTTDTDGDGLSDGYEDWFTYVPGAGISSQCSPRSTQLTCTNQRDSLGSGLLDGWKVAHGLNPMDNSGSNAASYVLAGDTLTSLQKQSNYYTLPPGHTRADYDPLELTASSSVRPVVTITASQTSPFGDLASFTISRDVGSNGSLSGALTVYYALGGSLVYGRDYLVDPPPQTTTDGYPRILLATIPTNQVSVTVTVSLTPKVVPVAAQSLTMTLVPYGSAQ